jgi:hypothetical protein
MTTPTLAAPDLARRKTAKKATGHIAGQTQEAFLEAGTKSWLEVKAVLAGNTPSFPVNADGLQKLAV